MPLVVSELGVRDAFVPRAGCAFLDADIAGLESVTLAQVEIWLMKDSRKADKINSGIDILSVTGAVIAGMPYKEFYHAAKVLEEPTAKRIRNLSKVPVYGKVGGMADETLVGYARVSYGITLAKTPENPRPTLEQMKAEARRIGGYWRVSSPEDVEYLNAMRTTRNRQGTYDTIIGHPSIGIIVRRGRSTYCAACNTPFQGLGALAAGEITWEIQRRAYNVPSSALYGTRLVLHAYDQWIIECPIPRITEAAAELQHVIETAGARMVPDVKLKAVPCATATFNKSAERVEDSNGNLLVWGTEECADRVRQLQEESKQ